jgi:hypothetical protein
MTTYGVFAPRVFDCRPHFLLHYALLHVFKCGMLPHLLFKRKHVLWDWTLIDKDYYMSLYKLWSKQAHCDKSFPMQ